MSRKTKGDLSIVFLYVALSVIMMNFGYGEYQIHIAGALSLLCLYDKRFIRLFVFASFVADLIGIWLCFDPYGYPDVIIGPLITFISLILMYHCRQIKYRGFLVAPMIMITVRRLLYSIASILLLETSSGFWPPFAFGMVSEFIIVVLLGSLINKDLKRVYERYYV